MDEYRRLQHIKYKYSHELELDLIKRSACRIQRFIKRYYLVKPKNLHKTVWQLIPPIYRFRCFIYVSEDIKTVNCVCDSQLSDVIDNDPDIIAVIELDRKDKIEKLLDTALVVPVIIDLRSTNFKSVEYQDYDYPLDSHTIDRMNRAWLIVKPDSVSLERFNRMLEWSKALAETYNSKKERF